MVAELSHHLPHPGAHAMRIEIKHRFTDALLFAHEQESNTMRLTVEAAVRADANLAGANLEGANLADACLFYPSPSPRDS